MVVTVETSTVLLLLVVVAAVMAVDVIVSFLWESQRWRPEAGEFSGPG